MKVLYAIQGTGNGHISRAREFIPKLSKLVDLEILISGSSVEVDPGYPVTYRFPGISYTFGKDGGIDYINTMFKLEPASFIKNVIQLDVSKYDLIINDYEPVSAWACKKSGLPCIGLSHQASFLSEKTPRPAKKNLATEWLFHHYAPTTTAVGFHYETYDTFISTPIIRTEIRSLQTSMKEQVTVYLPAYSDTRLISVLSLIKSVQWNVFSKYSTFEYEIENIKIVPVNNDKYIKSLAESTGLLCGAGFEAPAEALFLGKKLLVIPMRGQYEQECNTTALNKLGVKSMDIFDHSVIDDIRTWIADSASIQIEYPDQTDQIIDKILNKQMSAIND